MDTTPTPRPLERRFFAPASDTGSALPARPAGGRPRFLSEADCRDIAARLARYADGGGETTAVISSSWIGNVRWARNQIATSGEVRNTHVVVLRRIGGTKSQLVEINEVHDVALVAAARRAERLARMDEEWYERDVSDTRVTPEPVEAPSLFFEATYQMGAGARAAAAQALAQSAAAAGLLSAGYIAVSARSIATITSSGMARYCPFTWARYSVTVRDPTGTGSGWAGVDWPDWQRIDGAALSAQALDKCLKSRNPVAIEPGRYVTILEPQAACDFIGLLLNSTFQGSGNEAEYSLLDRKESEDYDWQDLRNIPFESGRKLTLPDSIGEGMETDRRRLGFSLIGEKVIDERLTIAMDLLSPDLGFPPFEELKYNYGPPAPGDVYHPVTWIERGVLKELAYNRVYAATVLARRLGMPNAGGFNMSVTGPMTSVDEMIAATPRGLLVTRFDRVEPLHAADGLATGYTRDGLWLIEHGKISKPVKNLKFTEAVMFALNNVEQVGTPQRAFHPNDQNWTYHPQPVVIPALKIRDFSFTATIDAV